jgi:hypothetical protein
MSRTKVLLSLDPDVLRLIDERALRRSMTRSGYVAAACLGLLDPDPTVLCGNCYKPRDLHQDERCGGGFMEPV